MMMVYYMTPNYINLESALIRLYGISFTQVEVYVTTKDSKNVKNMSMISMIISFISFYEKLPRM